MKPAVGGKPVSENRKAIIMAPAHGAESQSRVRANLLLLLYGVYVAAARSLDRNLEKRF